jgi:hypothetical protein
MKLLSDQTCQAWLSGLEQRLRRFFRDDLFELTRTADRDWWASVIEDAAETAQTISNLLDGAIKCDDGCLEASQQRARRVSIDGKQVYAYQRIYWAGNALIPSDDDVVRHKCHNRRCINPVHQTHGTQLENINATREK